MANKMPFQGQVAFGAAGSAFGSTIQITCPASQPVYLATSSQTILQGVLPCWAYLWCSSVGSQNLALQVSTDGSGSYLTWGAIFNTSVAVVFLDGTAAMRVLNANAVPAAVYITPIKQ